MRILLAHNYYQSSAPSGEDAVFRMERALLEQAGHDVIVYERHNDEIKASPAERLNAAVSTTWSRRSYRDLQILIGRYRPDVAHFHNTFPLISPSAYHACRDNGVPVVQTLHNFRLICPGALLLRDGRPCERCIGQTAWRAIQHGCYRQSRVASSVVTAMLSFNRARDTYRHAVDRYIALTEFARQRFVRGGLPGERIVVRPNFLTDVPAMGSGAGGYALYVGRLTAEKGVETLVDAWRGMELPLKIAGDGVLRPRLEEAARAHGSPIDFLGFKPRAEVLSLMQDAACLIIPSECYEGFPITALEAFATGTPIIAAAIGALDEVIAAPLHGIKFEPRNASALRAAVITLMTEPTLRTAMRAANRDHFITHYTPQHAVASLEALYRSVAAKTQLDAIDIAAQAV